MSLTTHQLEVGYQRTRLIGPVDLAVQPGEFVCLIGANGSGKSTLIRTLAGMQVSVSGSVNLGDVAISQLSSQERAKRLAVVLTERVTPPLLRGEELVSFGRYPYIGWSGKLGEADHQIIADAMDKADASYLAQRLVSELSDGERQKLMIARALAQQPDVLILDEATAFLDLPRRIEIIQLLQDLAHQHQLAVLLSTHDLDLALRYADTFWLIDGQRQLHIGGPEDLAMSGTLSLTFESDGLQFDLENAELRVGSEGHFPVKLTGSGIHFVWAKKALLRAGCRLSDSAQVRIHSDAGQYQLSIADAQHQAFDSMAQMVKVIKRLQTEPLATQETPA
ncbi:ABC transporter-like protein [Methylophaga frappieri]|uniref:ABC transporter-like protein n=1 Tax=Methylophaga frappieri (strain ATCC BAA-2434 / DSM 25690 / JAM7) TaxID=754477 RepID=I1YJE4_METFJ|nr:ABC transporter ATP-binding protein [Methylophaga frappieri]AFJ03037.1 ABC transporter-like protein [Methylophaga frappieri]